MKSVYLTIIASMIFSANFANCAVAEIIGEKIVEKAVDEGADALKTMAEAPNQGVAITLVPKGLQTYGASFAGASYSLEYDVTGSPDHVLWGMNAALFKVTYVRNASIVIKWKITPSITINQVSYPGYVSAIIRSPDARMCQGHPYDTQSTGLLRGTSPGESRALTLSGVINENNYTIAAAYWIYGEAKRLKSLDKDGNISTDVPNRTGVCELIPNSSTLVSWP